MLRAPFPSGGMVWGRKEPFGGPTLEPIFFDSAVKALVAEGVGFEPTRAFALPVFKTGAINRSTTPPVRVAAQSGIRLAMSKSSASFVIPISGCTRNPAKEAPHERGAKSPEHRGEDHIGEIMRH